MIAADVGKEKYSYKELIVKITVTKIPFKLLIIMQLRKFMLDFVDLRSKTKYVEFNLEIIDV
jgi:hypothetical protein